MESLKKMRSDKRSKARFRCNFKTLKLYYIQIFFKYRLIQYNYNILSFFSVTIRNNMKEYRDPRFIFIRKFLILSQDQLESY